jgi:integrase
VPFLDFMIDSVDVQMLKPKTVEGRAFSLKKWYQFLSDSGVDALDADDEMLVKFREHLFERTAPNRSGDAQARRRTINIDLRNVYTYYAWLQKNDANCQAKRLLGIEASQITSSLLAERSAGVSRSDRQRYPATYRNAGERSKHRLGFVPREEHRAQLTDYFYDAHPANLAKRNCLIFELAWSVGWRRGSILSLTIEQFPREIVLDGDGSSELSICPPSQKFGYSNSFPLERSLALRVLHYIEHERKEIVCRTESKSSQIFLSERSGRPLTAGAVSGIFNTARHAMGWPQGAGLHGWRRGFANTYIEREIDARIELGLDTGGEAIAMSLATALGQESLASQGAYVRDAQRRIRGTATFKDKAEQARLSDENAALRAEVARLRQLIK